MRDDSTKIKNNTSQGMNTTNSIEDMEPLSQLGKSPAEMLPYLLSGEADDLSIDFINEI